MLLCHRVFVGERSADAWAYDGRGRLVLFKYSQELATVVAQRSWGARHEHMMSYMMSYQQWAELKYEVEFDTLDYVPSSSDASSSSSSDEDNE